MEAYRRIADALAADIAAGRLRPGDRLPPQRQFAADRRIAASTAARAYQELVRRGLVVGEVGRGTFVRAAAGGELALYEPPDGRIDLEYNFPVLPEQPALLAERLGAWLGAGAMAAALRPAATAGASAQRQAAAAFLARDGWTPEPADVLFAGNGRQAIAASIAALVPPGERLGVEALTYPVVKTVAARLGVVLVPLAMDEAGLTPASLRAAGRAGPLRAVYLQPTLHNPLGVSMTLERRAELAETLRALGVWAIEDLVYAFLAGGLPPLASFAPDRTVAVDSLSKRLAPGLTLGFAVAPAELGRRVASALRSGVWTAPQFALAAGCAWMADGTVSAIAAAKQDDAALRQRTAREQLAGFTLRGDARSYHCWWELPPQWRADTFVAAAARRGIAVTPAAAFAVSPGQAPNAVRLALASPPIRGLAAALAALADIARAAPEEALGE